MTGILDISTYGDDIMDRFIWFNNVPYDIISRWNTYGSKNKSPFSLKNNVYVWCQENKIKYSNIYITDKKRNHDYSIQTPSQSSILNTLNFAQIECGVIFKSVEDAMVFKLRWI